MTTVVVTQGTTRTVQVATAGPQGVRGAQGWVWQGPWDIDTDYHAEVVVGGVVTVGADAVHHDGSAWLAVADSTGVEPTALAAEWEAIAEKGDTGPQGGIGPRGEVGPSGPAFSVRDFGAVGDGIANDAAAVVATIAAAAVNGGEVLFPAGVYLIPTQIVLPNDGGLIPAPTQKPIVWRGEGGHYNGQNALGSGGSRLLLTYQGDGTTNDAKIITRGLGVFALRDLVLQDTTALSETPFLYTTLTTLKVANVAFLGATAGTACKQDAIICGGTKKFPVTPVPGSGNGYGDPDAAFQGYGTTITGNYFNRVRRAVYGRSYANQIVVSDNFFDKGCGTNLVGGACIEFDASLTTDHPGDTCAGNVITGNYLEWSGGYYYQIKLTGAAWTYVAGNTGEDASPGDVAVALVGLFGHTIAAVDYPSGLNHLIGNHSHTGVVVYEDAISAGRNTILGGNFGTGAGKGSRLPTGEELTLGSSLKVPDSWTLRRATDEAALMGMGTNRAATMYGSLSLLGNSAGQGTTGIVIGSNANDADATLTLNPPAGKSSQVMWKRAGVESWRLYDGTTVNLYLRDQVNAKMHATFIPGAGAGAGTTELNSKVKIVGDVGFYSTAPAAKPTITGSRGGNAALASLLTGLAGLGLITDSTTA